MLLLLPTGVGDAIHFLMIYLTKLQIANIYIYMRIFFFFSFFPSIFCVFVRLRIYTTFNTIFVDIVVYSVRSYSADNISATSKGFQTIFRNIFLYILNRSLVHLFYHEMLYSEETDRLEWELVQSGGTARDWITFSQAVDRLPHPSLVAQINAVSTVYERGLRAIPYSYKLWVAYIRYRTGVLTDACSTPATRWSSHRQLLERAVTQLPKMPMLWVALLEFLMPSEDLESCQKVPPRITMFRHAAIRALGTLPIAQHKHIWKCVKRWTRIKYIPTATVKSLWHLYLTVDPSLHSRRAYFTLLLDRGHMSDLVTESVELFDANYSHRTSSLKEGNANQNNNGGAALLLGADMWDTIQLAFETKGWSLDVRPTNRMSFLHRLDEMVRFGAPKATSPVDFSVAYALFLYGQAHFDKGRAVLRELLTEATEPLSFSNAFAVAVNVEDELVESFIRHQDLLLTGKQCGDARKKCDKLMEEIFGVESKGDPLYQLRRLSSEHDIFLNQSQLRNLPLSVELWLKRVEIFSDQLAQRTSCDNKRVVTVDDVVGLFRQGLQKCTQGMRVVDASVAELYASFAQFLLYHNRVNEAISILEEGAWHTRFTSAAANADLLGMMIEVKILSEEEKATSKLSIATRILNFLSAPREEERTVSVGSKRSRQGLLTSYSARPTSTLATSALPWILAMDLLWAYGPLTEVERAMQLLGESPGYTAEIAAHLAYQLYVKGEVQMAIKKIECALTHFKDNSLGYLFLISQYISLLCLHYKRGLRLDIFREISQLAIRTAAHTMPLAPFLTVDVLMSCAAVERLLGLHNTAISLAQTATTLALRYLRKNSALHPLLFGLLETTIELTLALYGVHEVRTLCNTLIPLVADATPMLLQRIVVHWAALEKRSGFTSNAHTILSLYADSQDPDSPTGKTFWALWESICQSMDEFQVFVRRRQQAKVKRRAADAVNPESTKTS